MNISANYDVWLKLNRKFRVLLLNGVVFTVLVVLNMKRVLIIKDSLQKRGDIRCSLKFDKTVHVTTIDVQHISAKRLCRSLKLLRRTDLILLEDDPTHSGKLAVEDLLPYLQGTGMPIMVLPSIAEDSGSLKEPQLFNVTKQNTTRPGLKALIDTIQVQCRMPNAKTQHYAQTKRSDLLDSLKEPSENKSTKFTMDLPVKAVVTEPLHQQVKQIEKHPKLTKLAVKIFQITDQLRAPLANMNLAIHMLEQVQSDANRARYIKLLREEYNRELQLLNQLDNLREDLHDIPSLSSRTK